jgi:hypothetical protein
MSKAFKNMDGFAASQLDGKRKITGENKTLGLSDTEIKMNADSFSQTSVDKRNNVIDPTVPTPEELRRKAKKEELARLQAEANSL